MSALIETVSQSWGKGKQTNATDASFPAKITTLTEPVNDGVIDLRGDGGDRVPNAIRVKPYGTGADDATFKIRVLGWASNGDNRHNAAGPTWDATVLAELTCTLSTKTGVTGGDPDATHRWCDLLTLTIGNANVDVTVTSPDNNDPGHFVVDIKGFAKVEFIFNMNSSATAANCWWSPL